MSDTVTRDQLERAAALAMVLLAAMKQIARAECDRHGVWTWKDIATDCMDIAQRACDGAGLDWTRK